VLLLCVVDVSLGVFTASKDGTDDGCCENEEGTPEGEPDRLSDRALVGASDDTDDTSEAANVGRCEAKEDIAEGSSDRLSDCEFVGDSETVDTMVGSFDDCDIATEGASDVIVTDTEGALLCCNICTSFEGIAGKVTVGT